MEKMKILIDTDLGDDVDDAAALMLALKYPGFDILGITTVYKDTGRRKEMVEDLLRHWGRGDIPVHKGRGRALLEKDGGKTEKPIQYGLLEKKAESEDVPETAVDFILETVRKEPELVILELGCMTNLAQAFLRDAEAMKKVRIIAMGGAFFNTAPEWNIICDPEAASLVVETSENLIMMGLDVTKYLKVAPERLAGWKSRKSEEMDYYLKGVALFQEKTGYPLTLHDVLLVAYLIDPEVVTLRNGRFSVELTGRLTRGTMVDRTNYYEIDPPVCSGFQFAERVDTERFWKVMEQYF